MDKKQATRERVRRYRERQQSVTSGSITTKRYTPDFIPNYGQPDCGCIHCRTNKRNGSKHIINHGPYKTVAELGDKELNRVSLPGDIDYTGVCLQDKYKDRWITSHAYPTRPQRKPGGL